MCNPQTIFRNARLGTSDGQVLEENRGGVSVAWASCPCSSVRDEQFKGRTRSHAEACTTKGTSAGTPMPQLYFTHDANFNVTGVVNTRAAVQECVVYSAHVAAELNNSCVAVSLPVEATD